MQWYTVCESASDGTFAIQGDRGRPAATAIMQRFTDLVALTICLLLIPLSGFSDSNELQSLIDEAMRCSPAVLAARERVDQALAKHRELLEFYDPQLERGEGLSRNR